MRVEIKPCTLEFPLNFITSIIDGIDFGAFAQREENAMISG